MLCVFKRPGGKVARLEAEEQVQQLRGHKPVLDPDKYKSCVRKRIQCKTFANTI